MKEAYIRENALTLISVGRDCLEMPLNSREQMMKERANICEAMALMSTESINEVVLLTKPTATSASPIGSSGNQTLRPGTDIPYMFLSLHQYHDFFGARLVEMLKKLVNSKRIQDRRVTILYRTLYMLILTADKSRTKSENLKSVLTSDLHQSHHIVGQSSLMRFCKALNCYAEGMLMTHSQSSNIATIDERQKILDNSVKNLRHFNREHPTDDGTFVKQYFTIHVLLASASSAYITNHSSSYEAASKICAEAKKRSSGVKILQPL